MNKSYDLMTNGIIYKEDTVIIDIYMHLTTYPENVQNETQVMKLDSLKYLIYYIYNISLIQYKYYKYINIEYI